MPGLIAQMYINTMSISLLQSVEKFQIYESYETLK